MENETWVKQPQNLAMVVISASGPETQRNVSTTKKRRARRYFGKIFVLFVSSW
jgi:hypothetical protein